MSETNGGSVNAPVERTGVRRGLMQQEIYEQATRLFAQRGFAGTSIQDVADAVGLTRPALYHYVKSKDELLAKLVTEITVANATEIASIAKSSKGSATDRIREIVRSLVRRNAEQGERLRLLIRSEADLPEEIGRSYQENRRLVLRSLTKLVEQGISRGEFRPVTPEMGAFAVLGIINWVAWWYHPGSHFDLDLVAEELADIAVHGLAAEAGRSASATPLDAIRSLRRELDRLEATLKQA
jgi:AcrR family transcriptional regulator